MSALGWEAVAPNIRHPGEGRDLALPDLRTGEIPAFAGMTNLARAETGRFQTFVTPDLIRGP